MRRRVSLVRKSNRRLNTAGIGGHDLPSDQQSFWKSSRQQQKLYDIISNVKFPRLLAATNRHTYTARKETKIESRTKENDDDEPRTTPDKPRRYQGSASAGVGKADGS
ncbi:hypothetical protein EVAR_92569_1 [Eumeta japonica]|uniref:Uncharacterized protein n=1 Tax=Eumeta variegata TaxID=151549 RepID=A0A4C1SZG2_EUMVA|nr:hypothetical protein EVAR_92569_1 [Eumeta japonica]